MEVLYGMVFREKSPQPQGKVPRPFWLCLPGLDGSRAWFDRLLTTIGGITRQRELKCVYLDFKAPGNSHDPRKATGSLLAPLRVTVQVMLEMALVVPRDVVVSMSVHSGRHFLTYVAEMCREPADRAVEV